MKHFCLPLQLHSSSQSSGACASGKSHMRGFTLIELVVTIAILAVVVGFAIPSIQTLVTNNRVSTLANEFSSALAFTRGEAVNRNMCVTMCISTNNALLNPTCSAAATDWNNGWIIFANPNCNNNPNDVGDQLLQVYPGARIDNTGNTQGPQLSANNNSVRSITFSSRGVPTAISVADSYTVATGGTNSSPQKTVCIDGAGRARIASYDSTLCQ